MKAMKLLIGAVLVVSVGLNVFLWQQSARQRAETESARAIAAEADALRAENEALKKPAAPPPNTERDALELARLRNEVGQLRKLAAEAETLRVKEAAAARARLAAMEQKLAAGEKSMDEAAKLTPEEALALRQEAKSVQCINNMKQIGLAARIWAKEHNDVFPPNLASLKDQIPSAKVLFCPAAPGGVQAATWEELNPATISYQFLNPNGNTIEPQKPLTFCPFHSNSGLSDGSVYMNRKL